MEEFGQEFSVIGGEGEAEGIDAIEPLARPAEPCKLGRIEVFPEHELSWRSLQAVLQIGVINRLLFPFVAGAHPRLVADNDYALINGDLAEIDMAGERVPVRPHEIPLDIDGQCGV